VPAVRQKFHLAPCPDFRDHLKETSSSQSLVHFHLSFVSATTAKPVGLFHFLVASPTSKDLLISAKHLFGAAKASRALP
jgi:hypothetical protein